MNWAGKYGYQKRSETQMERPSEVNVQKGYLEGKREAEGNLDQ